MNNNITDMNEYFSTDYARQKLIDDLKSKGNTEEEIKKFIDICDKEYKENGTPYPTIN